MKQVREEAHKTIRLIVILVVVLGAVALQSIWAKSCVESRERMAEKECPTKLELCEKEIQEERERVLDAIRYRGAR
jgi:hypothetical protein